ncbi:MAG: DNA recombination protein RmuC [Clostridia bacterium]|nr:DNA recombination protein RmuC [Clostridia bacterium]
MDTMIVFYILSGVMITGILVIIALLLKNDGKTAEALLKTQTGLDALSRTVADEFARSRSDTLQATDAVRRDTAIQIRGIADRLEKMNKHTLEHELQLNQLLNNSMNQLQEKNIAQSEKQTRMLSEALERIRTGNEQKLEQMRMTVSEKLDETLQKRLDASFETVSKQLENLYKSLGEMKELSTGVTDNVTALNRVLTNVKTRGTWAEVQLKGILDQIIPGRYVENFSPKGTDNKVEFAVIIPAGDGSRTYMPLDSKFPVEDYIRIQQAAEAADPEALAAARKALRQRVINEARDVSSKYISVPETTPFAVMYLATEGLYAEVLSADDALAEKLHADYNILLAGPSTVTALLNSLAMGFRTLAVNEKAAEIRKMLAAVKTQYEKFGGLLDKAQKKVEEAGKVIDDARFRSTQIQKKLGKVDAVETGEAEQLLFDDTE